MKRKHYFWAIIIVALCLYIIPRVIVGIKHFGRIKTEGDTSKVVVTEIANYNEYFIEKNIINRYFEDLKLANEKEEEHSKIGVNKIYDYLDKAYVNYADISKDNLTSKLPYIADPVTNINRSLKAKKDNITIYLVEASVRNRKDNSYSNHNFVIVTDNKNMTYSLYLTDYYNRLYFTRIKAGDTWEINIPESIEKNDSNGFIIYNKQEKDYVYEKYEEIRGYLLYNNNQAFNMVANNQFTNQITFKKFISDNYQDIFTMTFDDFTKNSESATVTYSCKDKNNNIRIIIYANGYNDIKFEINKI